MSDVIVLDTKDWDRLLSKLLNRVERPRPLMKKVQRYVKAVTMKMFRGRRPDTSAVRGVKWPKLSPITLQRKKSRVKRGMGLVAARPLVDTGSMRDSIKVLSESPKGFLFGSRKKTMKGFSYPQAHNKGGTVPGKPPARPWLFLTEKDYVQMVKMIRDYLMGRLRGIM